RVYERYPPQPPEPDPVDSRWARVAVPTGNVQREHAGGVLSVSDLFIQPMTTETLSHNHPRTKPIHDPLYVVTMVSNPMRFLSRYRLYDHFATHMKSFHQVKL